MTQHILNAKNLLCPLPVIRTSEKIEQLLTGDVLTVIVTDPGSTEDIPCWCRINGHQITDITRGEIEISITILIDKKE